MPLLHHGSVLSKKCKHVHETTVPSLKYFVPYLTIPLPEKEEGINVLSLEHDKVEIPKTDKQDGGIGWG